VVLSNFREDLYRPEGEFQADPADEEPVKRRGGTLAVYLLFALIGSGSAFLWRYYGGSITWPTGPAVSKMDEISRLTVTLQLPHWLIVAGSVLVIVGTIGMLVSGRRRGDAPPEPSEGEATELQKREPKL
jgi:hypothetical protein